MLKKIVAATSLPVTVARAKERLHIDTSDFDNDLEALISASGAALESHTGLTIQPSSWEYRTDGWSALAAGRPYGYSLDRGFFLPFPHIRVPAAPVRSLTAVTYLDIADAEQTIDPANYMWERTSDGADVIFGKDYVLPVLSNLPGAVRAAFEAGYDDPVGGTGLGDDAELTLPPQAEMAILFLVGHWHRTRESVSQGTPYTVPQTFEYLADQLRIYR